MVYWWVSDLCFNNELIQISGVDIMNAVFGSSESFGLRVRSKCISHNTYTGIRSNFR